MSQYAISKPDVTLTHKGLQKKSDNNNEYRVAPGYSLSVTATEVKPKLYFGYELHQHKCELPEGSVFKCLDRYCKEISSASRPSINSSTHFGSCLGGSCMNGDWVTNISDGEMTRRYTLD
jgi:hypothetical protein